MKIEYLRKSIDGIDDNILKLLKKRMKIAMLIGRMKSEMNEDIYIPRRENEILNRLLKNNRGGLQQDALIAIFQNILNASRALQKSPAADNGVNPRAGMNRLARKAVLNFELYIPGKPIEEVKMEYRLKKVYKLASNENPEGPSKKAINAMIAALGGVNRYPDGEAYYLKNALAKSIKIAASNIILGSGTDELIEIIGKAFLEPQDEIVISRHAFIRYKMIGDLMGCRVRVIPMKKLKHDLKAMKKAITGRTKVVFIANPNNPTGTYVSSSEVAEFMKVMKEKNILVVFDEAYKEYVCEKDYPETVKYVRDGYPVIVLRTFSKIYSLAGLRAGYGISGENIINVMNRIRPPFNVNSVAQAAAIASLNDSLRVEKYRRLAFNEKIKLQNALEKSGIEFLPSAANFILIKVGNGRKVFNSLLRKGIIVRAMEEYELPEYIRVTIGLPEENKLFLKALKEVINEKN